MVENARDIKFGKYFNAWRCLAILATIACIALTVALIVVIVFKEKEIDDLKEDTIPCPSSSTGGLMTSGDPDNPSPFHDLTALEYRRIYSFLRQLKKVNLPPHDEARVDTASIFMMDLMAPPKQQALRAVHGSDPQPAREARVMMFRGDKTPPIVEEYRVGPLPNPTYADLIVNSQRRNPVSFSLRPLGSVEFDAIYEHVMPKVDEKLGDLLMESYGGKFSDCGDFCLSTFDIPVGTALLGNITRKIWFLVNYPAEYYTLHPLDFGVLVNAEGSDPTQWGVEQVWYSGTLYSSLDDLANKYANDPAINKTRLTYVQNTPDLMSSMRLRGDPQPSEPQRPPRQVEPDGKRYTIHHRHVKYLHWDFHVRLSAFTGPIIYDVMFDSWKIAYELGLAEISIFYSGYNPMQRVTNYVDSGLLIGTHSKSLIPGADCPEDATFLSATFFGEGMHEPTTLEHAQCVFEQNTGIPLRRHMSYSRDQGAFYGGMADSVLVVRSIMTIVNYDYLFDFVFHQNGAIECRAISNGYIMAIFHDPREAPYGFRLNNEINGNIHHHVFSVKADLDIGGESNRYETLDISEETVQLQQIPGRTYQQIRFDRHLYQTENEAVYKFNFDEPKYHLIHFNGAVTEQGVPRSYRLHMAGMSKQLLTPNKNNEKTIPWTRQQLAVTVQKDEELVSSSPYAQFDSLNPVTDFSNFIDGESIVDKDLVFWITMGVIHIPHTEDIPVTSTVGGHLSFFLLPYNFFPECPSMSSRDGVRVEYVTPNEPADGLKVERNGNKESSVCGAPTLEQLVKENPDQILQTNRDFKLF